MPYIILCQIIYRYLLKRIPGNHTTIHKALKKTGFQKDEMGRLADEFTENRVTELKVFNPEKGYFMVRKAHKIFKLYALLETRCDDINQVQKYLDGLREKARQKGELAEFLIIADLTQPSIH